MFKNQLLVQQFIKYSQRNPTVVRNVLQSSILRASSHNNVVSSSTKQYHTNQVNRVSDRETNWEKQHRERMAAQEKLWKDAPEKVVRYFVEFQFIKNMNRSKFLLLLVILFVGFYGYDKFSGSHSIGSGIYQMINGPKKSTTMTSEELAQMNGGSEDDSQNTIADKPDPHKVLIERIDPSRMRTFTYLDIEHQDSRFENNVIKGRIIIGLYDKVVPVTSYNFAMMCQQKLLQNTIFHRVINKFMLQGGDTKQGTGMSSVPFIGNHEAKADLQNQINELVIRDALGNVVQFKDENFELTHSEPYLLCMANRGPNTNGSQFFITTVNTPHLDGKHVVFGKVLQGMEIVDQLQKVRTSTRDKPLDSIKITDCGIIPVDDLI